MKNIENCAKGYLEKNILQISQKEGKEYRFMGIYSKNREEYTISEFAGHYLGCTILPIYDTLGIEGITYIIEETGLENIFTTEEGLAKLINLEDGKILRMIKTIILYDNISTEDIKTQFPNLNIILYEELLRIGAESPFMVLPEDFRPNPETIGLLCYTSGTTGKPKGVKLTHRNMLAGATGLAHFDYMQVLNNSDTYISYLPMAHVLERLLQITCFYSSMKIGFFNGDILKLSNDLVTLKPTTFGSVPRLYYKFYSVLTQKIGELKGFKKKLIDRALRIKLEKLKKTGDPTHKLYDTILFRKMKAVLGGKIKFLATGGAPIDKTVLCFLKVCFCCPIVEGYGQTENFGAGTGMSTKDNISGHIGAPIACTELKLVDVPEMEYSVNDMGEWDDEIVRMPRGEILLRGHIYIYIYINIYI